MKFDIICIEYPARYAKRAERKLTAYAKRLGYVPSVLEMRENFDIINNRYVYRYQMRLSK